MILETYGVNLTPHLEKYQDQDEETADNLQAVWNFGNGMKAKGWHVVYMHGPIGMYENTEIRAQHFDFKTTIKDWRMVGTGKHVDEFIEAEGEKAKTDNVYFLYQKLPNKLKYAVLTKEHIQIIRNSDVKLKSKRKKPVDKNNTVSYIEDKKGEPENGKVQD